MTTETRSLWVLLTETEKNERARKATDALAERDAAAGRLKWQTKLLKQEVEQHEGRLHDLSRAVREGGEVQSVACHWVADYVDAKMTLIRDDTFDIVESRPMTGEERQLALPVRDAARDVADNADGGSKKKRGRKVEAVETSDDTDPARPF